ncbi:hypothetical protein ACFX2I_039517 [Malus domestica]|uniref:SHSP domain-containing protein n=1 Tax=Malus domestica TaxID=3750 RepID=A0A498JSB0_MALDO|nr:uncharacterized protein LOC103409885 [Malus domestica]RXH96704.1 hypothetical protein DVH24_009208 [Malus domestica]
MENKATAESLRIYEDFEPFCKWNGRDEIELHLRSFRKEHLKVQIHKGFVIIHGERPLKESNGNTWRRFHKEIKLSDKCNPNDIHAKLHSAGVLTVTMPVAVNAGDYDANKPTSCEFKGQRMLVSRRLKVGKDVTVKLLAAVAVIVAFGFGVYVVKCYN